MRIVVFNREGRKSRPGTAWVLGGGSARGAAQVGVRLGLLEQGVKAPSAIHYLDLSEAERSKSKTIWLADAL